MSSELSENSEFENSLEESSLGKSSVSGNSLSLSLKTSDVLSSFKVQDVLQLIRRYWYVVFLSTVIGGCLFFFLSLTPPKFSADLVFRIRSSFGKNQVSETISLKGEAQDIKSVDMIRSTYQAIQHPTIVIPITGILKDFSYYRERRGRSGLISAMQPDRYNVDLVHFVVEAEEGTFYISSLGGGMYALYDSDQDEIFRARFGQLMKEDGIEIQIDAIYGEENQWYEMEYLSEDAFVAWVLENINTWYEGKDAEGGTITLTFNSYDKFLMTKFLNTMGKIHVEKTEKRLQKDLLTVLSDQKEKMQFIEQDLFKQGRALDKLQRQSAAKGNLAMNADELRLQSKDSASKIQKLKTEKELALDKYKDVRTIFSDEHPIVINSLEDLQKIERKIAFIESSTEGIPELLMKINNIEDTLESLQKDKQALQEEIDKLEYVQKGSKSYISVSQEAKLLGNDYIKKTPRLAFLGVMCGFILSLLGILVSNLRVIKTFAIDGDQDSFSDGSSVMDDQEQSTKSSMQNWSWDQKNSEQELPESEELSSQDMDIIFQEYSSEMDSHSNINISVEVSNPSELDAPNLRSANISMESQVDAASMTEEDLHFLDTDNLGENVQLLSTGVWNAIAFSEKSLKLLQRSPPPIVEILNNTEVNLMKAIISYARKMTVTHKVLVMDMQTDESHFCAFHKVQDRMGFWDVISKKAPIKSCLLQTSHRYFILPPGIYDPSETNLRRVERLMNSLVKRFSLIVILHSQDVSIWRGLRKNIPNGNSLFWLQADYSLYLLGSLPAQTKEEQYEGILLAFTEYWKKYNLLHLCNQSSISSVLIVEELKKYGEDKKILLIEAYGDIPSIFPSVVAEARFPALIEGLCSMKDAIQNIHSNFFVLPGGNHTLDARNKKILSLYLMVQKKFDHVLILHTKLPSKIHKEQAKVILDQNGTLRLLEKAPVDT